MRIGLIATRLAGIDGISLEAAKWVTVLERMGHTCFCCAGELNPQGPPGQLVPEMHYQHPMIKDLQRAAFNGASVWPDLNRDIERKAQGFKWHIETFLEQFNIDLLIVENASSLPLNLPLGIALAEVIRTTCVPTIAHHHDFYWERDHFLANRIPAYLRSAFPPDLPSIQHVVISTIMQRELKARTGIEATVVPNVFDFDNPPAPLDDYAKGLRADLGLHPDDVILLQPTRISARHAIERGIDLVRMLENPRYKYVITGPDPDEPGPYFEWLLDYAVRAGIETFFIADRIGTARRQNADGSKVYTLWDVYPQADLVTYPSHYEGFGRALIEAMYFKRPLVTNRYPVYRADIAPLGVQAIEFDDVIGAHTAVDVLDLLNNAADVQRMVDRNYEIGRQHFSYTVLERALKGLLDSHKIRAVANRPSTIKIS